MTFIGKLVLGVAFLVIFLGGLYSFVGFSGVSVQLGHIRQVFDMIAGNLEAVNQMFPVVDLMLAFSAVLSIEAVIMFIKLYKFIKGHFI